VRVRRGVTTLALMIALATAAGARASSSPPYLALAADGLAKLQNVWWNPVAGWYTTYPYKPSWGRGGLATLWDAFPAFETVDLVAIADPTPAHLHAVDTIAIGAERYWDPDIAPVPGYVYLRDLRGPRSAFFDDNGWWGIAFFDAYRATGKPRYLQDAVKAFRFIYAAGWASRHGGGVWWDTDHTKKTAEPLAAEALLGTELYEATHDTHYLRVAERMIAWANTNSWNATRGLYQRSDTSDTVMNYVQGMMIGAHLTLCRALKVAAWCRKAEQLAAASQVAFPPGVYQWAPETDAIYLRYLVELSREDHNKRWFTVADNWARAASANARDDQGLYTKRWDGAFASNDRLLTDAGTLMLFAEMVAVPETKYP
jgi:Glycosyl hydrolase family 76